MALYIPHSIFHLVRLLYVRLETFGPYYVIMRFDWCGVRPPVLTVSQYNYMVRMRSAGGVYVMKVR